MFGELDTRPDLSIITLIILLIGTVGNIMSLIVLSRKKLRQKNIGVYLIALCVSDLLVLYIALFAYLLAFTSIYGENYEKVNCHIMRFFRILSIECSSWITVAITVQRTFAVYRPLSTYLSSSSRYATPIKVLSLMFVVLAVICAIYTSSFSYENTICKGPHKLVRLFLFSLIYSFLPAVILIVCNVAIVLKVYRRPVVGQTPHLVANSAQTIRLVLAINIMFLICTLPSSILFTFANSMVVESKIITLILKIILSVNNAFNFVLYIVTSQSFREEIKFMCKSRKNSNIFAISHEIELQSHSAWKRRCLGSKYLNNAD